MKRAGLVAAIVATVMVAWVAAGLAAETLDPDATLRVAAPDRIVTWDPHRTTSNIGSTVYLMPVYDRLLQMDRNMHLQPMLATSWSYSADRLTLQMVLRQGVKFWDGASFDADVARRNLERAKRLVGPGTSVGIQSVQSIEAVDDHTIRLHLGTPDPTLLYSLASLSGMMVSPNAIDSDLASGPSGSGPYMLLPSQTTQTKVVLQRFDGYWNPKAAKVARIEITTIGDVMTRLNAFKAGELDFIVLDPTAYLEAKALAGPGKDAKINLYDGLTALALVGNLKSSPALAKPEVRQALSLAIDRKAISTQLFAGVCPATAQPFGPGTPGYIKELDDVRYDPKAARELLAKAGETKLTFTGMTPTLEPFRSAMQVIQAEWADIGVTLNVEFRPGIQAFLAYANGDANFDASTISVGPEPARALADYARRAVGGIPQSILDIRNKAIAAPQDGDESRALYESIDRTLNDTPVNFILCRLTGIALSHSYVVGADQISWLSIGQVFDSSVLGIARH